jgi:4'-phosphopantetheinyl transferase
MTDPTWTTPPRHPILVPGEVHVWRVPLDAAPERIADLRRRLSADEAEQADRFHFDIDRGRYVVAHAALRTLLAGYLGAERYLEPFETGPNGKPFTRDSAAPRFNLAHSRNIGLVAITASRDIGVDVEAIDRNVEVEHIADRFFSVPEFQALLALPAERRREGFFHIWSQKEAYLKGRGEGVAGGLDHFDVEPHPDRPARLVADRRNPDAPGRWFLDSLAAGAGFRATVALEGPPSRIRCFAWG